MKLKKKKCLNQESDKDEIYLLWKGLIFKNKILVNISFGTQNVDGGQHFCRQ